MTTFDWILLAMCLPWAIYNTAGVLYLISVFPADLITVQTRFYVPFMGILFVMYRVWG